MQPKELSYFKLNLLSFLAHSHPDKIEDEELIKSRSDQASIIYEKAVQEGNSHLEAEEKANTLLFQGLQFSKYDTLVEVLWNEFPDYVNPNEALEFAKKVLTQCEEIFSPYSLSDDFAYSPQYDTLYTELTGWFQQWIEDYEL